MTPTPSPELVQTAALVNGVCIRPVISRVTDTATGETRLVPISCGSTREDRCPPCADRARRLRMHQCREGWHLDTEPDRPPAADTTPAADAESEDRGGLGERRVRSTRRRQDAPELPRVPMSDRTVAAAFEAPDGRTYRPSMFLTLTLPSYGRVTTDGVPVNPGTYDYRRAALDALHFPKLVDRFWQNLRRCAGYRVQYFAAVEAQRRLAPHLHAAARGVVPRRVFHEARAATYHQLWWPAHDTPIYVDRPPAWTEAAGYIDPDTRRALPTWDEAMAALEADPDARPAHVLRFGTQDDYQGLLAGSPDADRGVGYLCKYLTKSIAATYDDRDDIAPARVRHIDRLAEEVRWLPCSERCANWLRYGIQPDHAAPGMVAGHCKHKAHDRDHLGLGGRRVLVSRHWTGKTLTDHRADRAAVVRAALEEAGIDPDDHHDLTAARGDEDGWSWELLGRNQVDERTYMAAITIQIDTRRRWRDEYAAAKARSGPPGSPVRQFGNDQEGRTDERGSASTTTEV